MKTPATISSYAERGAAWLCADQMYRAHEFAPSPTAAPEVAFLSAWTAQDEQLARALRQAWRMARFQGVSVDRALLAGRFVCEDDFYRALAHHLGAVYIHAGAAFASDFDYMAAAQAGLAPLRHELGGLRWLYAPRGRVIAALCALPKGSGLAIASPRRFNAMLLEAQGRRIAEEAASSVQRLEPRLSAGAGPGARERLSYAALAAAVSLYAWWDWSAAYELACFALSLCFVNAMIVRLLVIAASNAPEPSSAPAPAQDLPYYTLIIALYRESAVAGQLVEALERLDYPRAKLDIKFVVENDDGATARALAQAIPGVEYEILVAPDGSPRTKPRALNIALPFARGEIIAVYDAEDAPAPDQLRKAAGIFKNSPPEVACLQARLVIDNWSENWIAAYFAIDYAALFECVNPGLAALSLPIALGGTSNHFRADILRGLGGWDAWNVTEDADLGIRLARCGFRVQTFQSRTYEESPTRLRPFLRQRMRWMKGRMQTAFVHGRDLSALMRNLGFWRYLAVFGTSFANLAGPMLWPFCMMQVIYDIRTGVYLSQHTTFKWLQASLSLWLLCFGLVALLWAPLVGLRRQGARHLTRYLVWTPIWHVLLSMAAWLALLELTRKPFYWAKTDHDVSRRAPPPYKKRLRRSLSDNQQ